MLNKKNKEVPSCFKGPLSPCYFTKKKRQDKEQEQTESPKIQVELLVEEILHPMGCISR